MVTTVMFHKDKKRDDGAPVEGGNAAEFQQKLDVYFGRREGLGKNEMFLK